MKMLCDVHIPYRLVSFLNGKSIEAVHVNTILKKWNTPDEELCRYADANDLVIVTKDTDFRNSYLLRNTPKKLIRLTLGNISNQELLTLFDKNLVLFIKHFSKGSCYIELDRNQATVIHYQFPKM